MDTSVSVVWSADDSDWSRRDSARTGVWIGGARASETSRGTRIEWGGGVEASMLWRTRTPTVIRPSPYTPVDGHFRVSGLVSRMTAIGHGVTALGRASGSGVQGRARRAGGRGSSGEEASRRRCSADPHPDCHSTVALQPAVGAGFRESGLRARMRAVARGGESARTGALGAGEQDEQGDGRTRGEEASMVAGPHPDCHSTVALQRVWMDTSVTVVWSAG